MTALKIRYYVLDFIIFSNTPNLPTVLSFKVKINSIPTKKLYIDKIYKFNGV